MLPSAIEFAEESNTSVPAYEISKDIDKNGQSATIHLKFETSETINLEKITLPDGSDVTENLSSITYEVTENGKYEFKVDYITDSTLKT